MTLSTEAAKYKTELKRQLRRLKARPQEGGPFLVYRDGQLLASGDRLLVVTQKMIEELSCLRVGTSVEEVWRTIEKTTTQ